MKVSDAIRERVEKLIEEAPALMVSRPGGGLVNAEQHYACSGWLASARNIIELVCPPLSAYRHELITASAIPSVIHRVGTVRSLLQRLMEDVDAGLIAKIEDRVAGEAFDNFLDHAEPYLRRGKKNEAAVIVGVVFEDTIRRTCRHYGMAEMGFKLDTLISDLQKKAILSPVGAKRARAAAGLRTSATHARWEEFELKDVQPSLEFTREMIETHLA